MAATDSVRIDAVERAVQEIRDAVGQIAEAMVAIARLEERHQETRESLGRAFDRLGAIEKTQADHRVELVTLRSDIKPLQESRGWLVTAVLAVVGIVGAAVIGLVVMGPK